LGGDFRLEMWRGYPAGWNDATVTGWLTQTGADFIGADKIDTDQMGLGAEDFAYMCQKVPGAMFMLGAAVPDGVERNHHTNIFDIDESALPIGVAILAETARRFLAGEVKLPPKN
jgi:amidohydrolase